MERTEVYDLYRYSIERKNHTNDRVVLKVKSVEFKEAKTNYSFNDIGKYFSALSNEANIRGFSGSVAGVWHF